MDSGTERKQTDDYFSWEASYAKIWSVILDDSSDSIQGSINKFNALQQKRLTRNLALIPGLKKGLIRNFIIVIEASKVAEETDLFPTRLKWILNRTCKFAKDYLEQNPLCQLGVVITRGGIAEKLIDLTSSCARGSTKVITISRRLFCAGECAFKVHGGPRRRLIQECAGSEHVLVWVRRVYSVCIHDMFSVETCPVTHQERFSCCSADCRRAMRATLGKRAHG